MDRQFANRADKLGAFAFDLIFPQRCPLCGEVINWRKRCCDKCHDSISYTGGELCTGCGNHTDECCCDDISDKSVSEYYAAAYYCGTAKSAVVFNKHTPDMLFPRLAAEKLARDISKSGAEPELIVPVPIGRIKRRMRGYNQAELLAAALSEKMDIPICAGALRRHDRLFAQHTKSAGRRSFTADGTYYRGECDMIENKVVLLCDDVITTGSTMRACADILLEMGARRVIAAAETTTLLDKDRLYTDI